MMLGREDGNVTCNLIQRSPEQLKRTSISFMYSTLVKLSERVQGNLLEALIYTALICRPAMPHAKTILIVIVCIHGHTTGLAQRCIQDEAMFPSAVY